MKYLHQHLKFSVKTSSIFTKRKGRQISWQLPLLHTNLKKRQDATEPTPSTKQFPKIPSKAPTLGKSLPSTQGVGKFFTTLADPSCREADQVFLRRKSLHLRLADNYLIKLWGTSVGQLYRGHLKIWGSWTSATHHRKPKRQEMDPGSRTGNSSCSARRISRAVLVSHSGQQSELQGNLWERIQRKAWSKAFMDYLYDQKRVSKGAWAYFLRTREQVKTFGYLLSSIHRKIQHRPDVLENILFDAGAKTQGKTVGRLYHQWNQSKDSR